MVRGGGTFRYAGSPTDRQGQWEKHRGIMQSIVGYGAAIASLHGHLSGTAPPVSFAISIGAGSGAQGKGKRAKGVVHP